MFGGVFKRKDKIITEDDEFAETKRFADVLEAILTSVQEDFAKVPSLDKFLQEILERIEKVAELQKELGKEVPSFSREVERNRKSAQTVSSEFKEVSTWLIKYPFSKEGNKIREKLLSMQSEYSSNQTTLENIHKQISHFLSGAASPGEEVTVWESSDAINDERMTLISSLEASPAILEAQQEKLEKVSGLVQRLSGYPLAPGKALTGLNTFTRESGIGIDMLYERPLAIFSIAPKFVGNRPRVVLGKKSGATSIRVKLEESGLKLEDEEKVQAALAEIKRRSIERKALIDDDEFREIIDAIQKD